MLDEHPRQQLRFIIDNHGRSIIENPRRFRGMLKDLAPKHIRETNLLMLALDNHIVAALMQKTHTPLSIHLDGLAQRLHNNFGTQKEFAFWAVESWALALDVIQSPLAQKTITPEPAPILKPEPKIIVPPKPAPVISSNKIGKFIVQDGVATDTETGLIWLRFAHGQRWENGAVAGDAEKVNWNDAMKIPGVFNQQSYSGYHDWRVPTIDELKTLIDKNKNKGEDCIDSDVFHKNGNRFWSSSFVGNESNNAWSVGFYLGYLDGGYKSNTHYVRLVRG
jgi:hypothetical protein